MTPWGVAALLAAAAAACWGVSRLSAENREAVAESVVVVSCYALGPLALRRAVSNDYAREAVAYGADVSLFDPMLGVAGAVTAFVVGYPLLSKLLERSPEGA